MSMTIDPVSAEQRCKACGATRAPDGKCYVCEQGGVEADPRWAWEVFVSTRPDPLRDFIEMNGISPTKLYTVEGYGDSLFQVHSFDHKNGKVTMNLVNENLECIHDVVPSDLTLKMEIPWSTFPS